LVNDNFKTEYSFLNVFYNYIECISRTVTEYIGENATQLILSTPFKANITSEFKLKDIITRTRFNLIDIICENNLINLFRKITSHMQQFSDVKQRKN
jgi:hypothetical protein